MKTSLFNSQSISVCNNSGCIRATGKYADQITKAIIIVIFICGVGFLLKQLNNPNKS
jgi:hypothetical protein